MDKPTLLIADEDPAHCQALTSHLQNDFSVTCCADGRSALQLLRSRKTDFLILDLLLPFLDGLSLLQSAAMLPHPPKVLVITRMYTDHVLDTAAQLGIQYIIRKPCDIAKAAARLRDIYAAQFRSPEEVTREIFLELHVDLDSKSGKAVCQALPIVADNPDIAFRKELYPAIGPNAERNIRYAIEHAWANGPQALWQTYFPGYTDRPSNRDFLRCMARELNRRLLK